VSEGDLIRKDELSSAVEARRELGREYEDELLSAMLERIEKRIDERIDRRVGTRTESRPQLRGNPFMVPIALGSVGMGIPITAIAAQTGVAGIALAWIGIAGVNLAAALSGRRR
jgi:hypothetical protein